MRSIVEVLQETGAVLTKDHFVYTSGKHGSVYVAKDALYPHPKQVSEVGLLFADKFKDENIDVVVGPALGGIVPSTWTAHHLSQLTGREVLGVYTEKTPDGNQVFTRGYDKLVKGKRVLGIEDVLTTGESIRKVVNAVRSADGILVGACAMINRDPEKVNSEALGFPLSWLGVLKAEAFGYLECPLCHESIPVNVNFGHGRQFLEQFHKS